MLYSVIDIGSNTVKCQVYSVEGEKIISRSFFTRQLGLIAKITDGALPEYAVNELTDTINEYKSYASSTVYCFATESLRKISNLSMVRDKIKTECGLDVELISGTDEALLSFSGFIANSPHITEGLMVDMGGGSTEILKFKDGNATDLNSFRFGCLSLRKEYVKNRFPTEAEIAAIKARVSDELKAFPWINNCNRLCLIGGTGSAIGKLAIELGYSAVPEFTSEAFTMLFEYLSQPDDNVISLLEKYIPARIETILPGMCAYKKIIERVNADRVYVSHGGIRDGYLYKKLRG